MLTDNTKPNFFILLDLNPDDPWDQAKFEQALRAKKNEWSRQSGRPDIKGLTAKKNLELIKGVQDVLGDPIEREKQVQAARQLRTSNSKERIETFERELARAEAKGYLEKAELEKLIAEFKDVLTEQEIKSRIKVEVRTADPQTKEVHRLDPSTLNEINMKLQSVNISDLYELLGMHHKAPAQELCNAAQQLYNNMVNRQPKTTEVTAKSALAGHAKVIFKSEEMRKEYNESLRQRTLDALLKGWEASINRTDDKVMSAKQVSMFLEDASKAGWNNEQALTRLRKYARDHRWILTEPTIDAGIQTLRCGYCDAINEKGGRNFCRQCNRELIFNCPNCGRSVLPDESGCGKCGFLVGNRYWVDDSLAEIYGLLTAQETKAAEERLKIVEGAWTPSKPDGRVQKIREYKAEIQRLMRAQQQTLEQLHQLIDRRQFYTARQFLSTHVREPFPNQQVYQNAITEGISQAQNMLKRAQSLTISHEEKAELCLQALHLCADYKDARDLLSTMPPAPPHNLQARAGGTSVNLTWDPSPSHGVEYKIVRKSYSQPTSLKDGQLLETVTGQMYDDTRPEVGVPLFYAVFTLYEEIVSTQAATLQQPVMLTQNVTNVTVRIADAMVDLSWQVPSNTHSVLVIRKDNMPPQMMNDGMRLSLIDFTHLVDTNVQNGHTYFYGIFCQFKDHNGRLVNSPGITRSATPEIPPAPITHLLIESTKIAQGYQVRLSWQPPTKGRGVVLRSAQQMSLRVGEVIPASQLDRYGQILQDRQDTLTDEWTHSGIGYYTPVVIFREMAYIGASQRYACVDDVSNLKYQNIGIALRMQWSWPANCQEVIVAYGYNGWPQLDEATANIRKVTRAEYDFHGHYDIRGATNQDHYIVVAAIIKQGSEQIIAPGARVLAGLASKIVVTYEIRQPKFGRKKRTLHLYVRTPGQLPALLLVSKRDGLPFRKTEGEPFHQVEGPLTIEKELAIELPDKAFPPRTFGKLYLVDDHEYNVVTIQHPSEDKLRLG